MYFTLTFFNLLELNFAFLFGSKFCPMKHKVRCQSDQAEVDNNHFQPKIFWDFPRRDFSFVKTETTDYFNDKTVTKNVGYTNRNKENNNKMQLTWWNGHNNKGRIKHLITYIINEKSFLYLNNNNLYIYKEKTKKGDYFFNIKRSYLCQLISKRVVILSFSSDICSLPASLDNFF